MIYILTGIAKSGKSLVAKEMIKRRNLSLYSTDLIMMMLYKGNKELDIDIDASDSSVSKKLEPYLESLIHTMSENIGDYLIEGVHFNTDFSRKLLDRYPNQVRILYMGYKDSNANSKKLELNTYKDSMENPWFSKCDKNEFNDLVEYLIDESKRVYLECVKMGLEYIEIRNIMEQMDEAISKLFYT